jgi:hypothetical protein
VIQIRFPALEALWYFVNFFTFLMGPFVRTPRPQDLVFEALDRTEVSIVTCACVIDESTKYRIVFYCALLEFCDLISWHPNLIAVVGGV